MSLCSTAHALETTVAKVQAMQVSESGAERSGHLAAERPSRGNAFERCAACLLARLRRQTRHGENCEAMANQGNKQSSEESETSRRQRMLCDSKFGLSQFDLEGFREDISAFSGMLPGTILRMCAAASDIRYQYEGRIKSKLLHADYLMKHCQGIVQPGNSFRGA